jgi:hypothetical protein
VFHPHYKEPRMILEEKGKKLDEAMEAYLDTLPTKTIRVSEIVSFDFDFPGSKRYCDTSYTKHERYKRSDPTYDYDDREYFLIYTIDEGQPPICASSVPVRYVSSDIDPYIETKELDEKMINRQYEKYEEMIFYVSRTHLNDSRFHKEVSEDEKEGFLERFPEEKR